MSYKLPRRSLLGGALSACTLPALFARNQNARNHGNVNQFFLRRKYVDAIKASRKKLLDELQPTESQLEHGLHLHYNSFVADMQGSQNVLYPYGVNSEKMDQKIAEMKEDTEIPSSLTDSEKKARRSQLEADIRAFKALDSAFNTQCRNNQRAIYHLAGVNLGTEDVAHPSENSFDETLTHIARANLVYDKATHATRVAGPDDIPHAHKEDKTSIVFHMAGVGAFAEAEDPVKNLDLMYALGVRMSQLTYNQDNKLCCSWLQGKDTGLKPAGKDVVRRMNELGMIIDLAHAGLQTSYDVIEYSQDPVVVSHTACRSLFDPVNSEVRYFDNIFKQAYMKGTPKPDKPNGNINVEDDVIKMIGEKGGLIGLLTLRHLYVEPSEGFTFKKFVKHLEHVIDLAGIDHVGIGSDRGFFTHWGARNMNWENWPLHTVGLVCHGFSDDDIKKIIGGNYLRCLNTVLDKKPWGAFL